MAAPTPGTRLDPTGIKLDNGHKTLVDFSADHDASVWEIGITPPGIDGGEAIDTTTQHNDEYFSMAPRTLKRMTPFSMTCAYDPVIYSTLVAIINVEQTITIHYPDTSKLAFYGFLQSAIPGELAEGVRPTMTLTVTPTNADPTTGAEEDPVLVNAPGT